MDQSDSERGLELLSRRRFLQGVGLGAIGISFTSAGSVYAKPLFGPTGAKVNGGKLDVTYWTNIVPKQALMSVLNGFGKKYKVPVKYDPEPSVFGDTVQKFTTYLSSGYSGIDVLWIDDFMTASFGTAGWLSPLDKIIPRRTVSAVPKAAIALSTYGGHLVRIPANLGIVIFYYRKDVFDKEGLKPPRTWNDIVKAGKHLTKGGHYGIGMAGKNGNTELFNEMTYWLPQAGGDVLHLTKPASMRGLKFMHDLIQVYKIAPPDTVTMDYTALITNFEEGRIMMWPSWDGFLATFKADTKFWKHSKVAVAYPPKGPANNSTITAEWGWSINKYSKNQGLAGEFIKYATTSNSENLLAKTGSLPADVALLSTHAVQKELIQAKYDAAYTKHVSIHRRPITSQAQRISDAVEAVINRYLNNGMSLDAAAKQGQQRIDQILSRG